jgi:hypothetical protein
MDTPPAWVQKPSPPQVETRNALILPLILIGLAILSSVLWRAYARPDIRASRFTRWTVVGAVVCGVIGGALVAWLAYTLLTLDTGSAPIGDILESAVVPGVVAGMCLAGATMDTYAFLAGRRGPSRRAAIVSIVGGPILAVAFFWLVLQVLSTLGLD